MHRYLGFDDMWYAWVVDRDASLQGIVYLYLSKLHGCFILLSW